VLLLSSVGNFTMFFLKAVGSIDDLANYNAFLFTLYREKEGLDLIFYNGMSP
jgi:hypothetical protein